MQTRTADYILNNTVFKVTYVDITQLSVDAIVSSDDNFLSMGGGVSEAIYNAGGETIRLDAQKHVPLTIGDVVVTSAGSLKPKYIFHAVTIEYSIDYSNVIYPSEENIRKATLRCMQLADHLRIRTIAFPALGTGTASFPFQLAAETMISTITDYLVGDTSLKFVIITLWTSRGKENELNIFYEQLAARASNYTQSKKLSSLLVELKQFTDNSNNNEASGIIVDLLDKLKINQNILAEKPENIRGLMQINRNSAINEIGNKIAQVTSKVQDTITFGDNSKADETIFYTKITGLQNVINTLISERNRLEIEKAKYGGIGVPPILLTQIENLYTEVEEKENQLKFVRSQQSPKSQTLCDQFESLKENYQRLVMQKMTINEFFEIITDPIFKFLSNSNNKKKIGEVNSNALNLLLISLSGKVSEYNSAENIGDDMKANIVRKECMNVIFKVMDKLDEICV